jgi:hypothetical protein
VSTVSAPTRHAITRLDHAQLVRAVLEIRDRCDELLAVLLPDGDEAAGSGGLAPGGCPHPPALVEDLSAMGDDEALYRCGRCGAEQPVPFHTPEDPEE